MATFGLPDWPWNGWPTDRLPPPEALLLEAMRRWAAAARAGAAPLPAARPPLIAEDVGDAAAALDALLRLARGTRPAALGCLLCPRLVGDEPALLLALALAQRGPRREALAAFCRFLAPPQAYAAMGPAIGIGLSLRRAGLLLCQPLRVGRPRSLDSPTRDAS
jgi:hypothetical protein